MRVEMMLNPAPSQQGDELPSAATSVPHTTPPQTPMQSVTHPSTKPKGHKLPKDAPVFRKGPPKGNVQFPPHEAGDDEELKVQHVLFQVYPMGEIADYCHRIPYSSDKNTFLSKTGRAAFEVFQYTFKLPGEDKEYVVMWDYNIGLVRITPFFKCCKYSKTTPAKVLNGNPGLREISHSITGGALAAQGYWMPFECAKAVAATFCYTVRYALTPLFGKGFLDICLSPIDPSYANFKIDRQIIEDCTAEAQLWLNRSDARATPTSSREPSETPGTPRLAPSLSPWKYKILKPKLAMKDATPESGYGTDTDWSEGSRYSPHISPKSTVASINRSSTPLQRNFTANEIDAAEGMTILASQVATSKQPHTSIPRSCVDGNHTPRAKRPLPELDENYGDDERSSADENKSSTPDAESKKLRFTEARAAHFLLQLRLDGPSGKGAHREKRARTMSI